MKKIKSRIKTIFWALKLAWEINNFVFLGWIVVSILIAILPALEIMLYQQIIKLLSTFYSSGHTNDSLLWGNIAFFAIVLVLQGIAKRINGDLLYLIMYDAYYLGMEEYVMDMVNDVDMLTLMDKKYRDEYQAIIRRCGSLNDFMSNFCVMLSKTISIVLLLVMSLKVSNKIFIMLSIYIAFVLIISILFADKAWIDYVQYREYEHYEKYYQNIVMNPGVAKEVRIYGIKQRIVKLWKEAYTRVTKIDSKVIAGKNVISFLSGLGLYICMALVMMFSIKNIFAGKMTVDVFLLLYYLGENLSTIVKMMISSLLEADRGVAALERQRSFIQYVSEEKNIKYDKTKSKKGVDDNSVISLEDVTFTYDGKNNTLENINLKIHKGDVVALVGANGCGKSTLAKIISGIYKPTKGSVLWEGKEYSTQIKKEIQTELGIAFQDFYMFHASIMDNIGIGDIEVVNDEKQVTYAMKKGCDKGFYKKLIDNLDKWIGREVRKEGLILSGGEKQKIAVSRAYMGDKMVYIFDEPSASLDPIAEMEQFMKIRNRIEGKTAILVSHRVGFARLADKIVVLANGKITEIGTHDELMKKEGQYAELYKKQAEWYQRNE